MTHDDVRDALRGSRFSDVRFVAETGSTNADVLALARSGAPEGVVVVADHQHAGRGRLERRWEAPPGSSLLVSLLTRPVTGPLGLPVDALHRVSTAMGVAAAEAVEEVTGVPARIKWPNDLVVDRPGRAPGSGERGRAPGSGERGRAPGSGGTGTRKLSGILAETHLEGARVEAVVVGIGVNVNWPDELPEDLAGIATALNLEAERAIDREAVLVALLRRFGDWYASLSEPTGAAALVARYRELSATLGRRVRIELPGETIVGDAFDLTTDGHLLVIDECPDRPREITVGDVVHLRAT